MLHAATIEVPSGFEHPPRAPVAPRAPRGERGSSAGCSVTFAAASGNGARASAQYRWWRRVARFFVFFFPRFPSAQTLTRASSCADVGGSRLDRSTSLSRSSAEQFRLLGHLR